jgi:hypothetical protein
LKLVRCLFASRSYISKILSTYIPCIYLSLKKVLIERTICAVLAAGPLSLVVVHIYVLRLSIMVKFPYTNDYVHVKSF